MCSQNISRENDLFKEYKSTLLGFHNLPLERQEKIRKAWLIQKMMFMVRN